jgi:hypothetical protein
MTPQERADFISDIAAALLARQQPVEVLSDDEVRALRLWIKKQEQSIAFRQSVIEKTTGALIKSLVTLLMAAAVAWFATHIYKP